MHYYQKCRKIFLKKLKRKRVERRKNCLKRDQFSGKKNKLELKGNQSEFQVEGNKNKTNSKKVIQLIHSVVYFTWFCVSYKKEKTTNLTQ